MADWNGKVALITGGASGMGASVARIVVREGGKVGLCDLNEELGARMVDELGKDNAVFHKTDVSSLEEMTAFVDGSVDHFGQVDAMFNNAGIGGMGSVIDLDEAGFERVIRVDLFSVFFGCKAVLKHMIPAGKGAILNNASISGMFGEYGMSSYAAAKGGVINLSRSIALDVARRGIRVNTLCPGTVDTPLFSGLKKAPSVFDTFVSNVPMGRIGAPDEIGEVAAFLLSDKASYLTGAVIPVDGGITCKTGFPDLAPFMEELQRAFNS
ncbi:SDR family NAD(P)-dependent oxidoreductase [Novosphingobium colocasiae]|uniref:Short chain dehydrogenase n=1 Tax=Novosphingobium colocasiae TaxID=1256513 RepID=A0A918UDV4_9SPHN|nr:SDR family NAD(P)-dependent oxidoreductase [Novosphingobium colocasiae]GGY98182.1 short chain dehydrogenase [Novosphingobium colocasiae]